MNTKSSRIAIKRIAVAALVIAALAGIAGLWWYTTRPAPKVLRFPTTTAGKGFDYEPYAQILSAHVDDRGMVNYGKLKSGRQPLDEFAARMGKLDRDRYEGWSDAEKIAFWINGYNALTLELIIEHYPIKRSAQPEGLKYPANSIRQIPGHWTEVRFEVMGSEMTLNQIEHEVLRKQFNEPRIHLALVCAARGCPPLRNEPYVGEKLDAQLDDQARRFLSDTRQFRIDRESDTVHLSSIFKWFGDDFVKKHGTDERFSGRKPQERAVLNFASGYLPEPDKDYLLKADYRIDYLSYDWSLNEQ